MPKETVSIMQPEGWDAEYHRLKGEFIRARSTGTLIPNDIVSALQTSVTALFNALRTMKKDLNLSVSHSEFSRMEVICENLRKQIPLMTTAHLLSATNQAGQAGSPGGLEMNTLSSATNPLIPNAAAGGGGGGANAKSMGNFSDRGLVQRQHEVIAQQNLALKDIEKGVSRLHEQAVDIGSEAKLHLHIISKLDVNVDAAANDLRTEAKHAETVRLKSRMCCLYLFLGMEIAVLIILLIVVFQYEGGFRAKGSNAKGRTG